ncbi:glycosyltransferase family 4 protein [Candidatus Woesebacteria bacterium]|nr:glycosyltransferase family 4 protein [Candidatus Woesebacteria bacterium]
MALPIVIYDPTQQDEHSKVRGVGRYVQLLKLYFNNAWQFTGDVQQADKKSLFIQPFFNPIGPSQKTKPKGVKNIAIIHDLIPLTYPLYFPLGLRAKWSLYWNKQHIKRFDLVVTDSLESKKDIVSYFKIDERRVHVVYPTVLPIYLPHLDTIQGHRHPFHKQNDQTVFEFSPLNIDAFLPESVKQQTQAFIVYVGDATWNKNLPTLARAIKMANVPCVFVGNVFSKMQKLAAVKPHPWQKSLLEFTKLAESDKRFIFPGYVSDVELMALYKYARANILISHNEGFGFSFIEAGYMSTPSILSNIPIFHETAGNAALFVNQLDPKNIANAIIQLFYDAVSREKMSIEAFDRAQQYNPNNFINRWNTVISALGS